MSHIGTDTPSKYGSLLPPKEWRVVNSQITKLVNTWANRDDLVASIGADQGGATAFFNPRRGEIQINTSVAFGEFANPSYIGDLNERKVQFEFPKAAGAIFHEASHAKFTTWDLKAAHRDLTEKENEAMHNLEESRIEGLALMHNPENKSFLRTCALEIVLGDMADEKVKAMSGIRQAAHLAALGLARVDAGVLLKKDTKVMRETLERILTADTLRKMQAIWTEFQKISHPENNLRQMYTLAKRWAALLDEVAKDEDEQNERNQQIMDAMRDLMKQLGGPGGQMEQTEIDAQSDVYDQQRQEKREAAQKAAQERKNEKNANKKVSEKIMNKETPKGGDSSGGQLSYSRSRSAVRLVRDPTLEERRAALTISHALEKAKYHDRIRIESNSVTPPGRLRTRAAVQSAAYKTKGLRIQTEPFRRVQRKHEIDPNLSLGVMFDISGSMSHAMEPMGATGWIMSEAVRRIQGTFAMVSYGHSVTPIVKPGQHQRQVTIYDCPDGSEAFGEGFQALDGALNLLDGSGARLLVVVSDGNYKGVENSNAVKWLKRCDDEGVAVLWLGYGHPYGAEGHVKGTNAQFVIPARTPDEVAIQVGRAATQALNRAGTAS